MHQAWSSSYSRVFDVFDRLARDDRTEVATVGITPTIAAQLDDPHCLSSQHTWLADWLWRAAGAGRARDRTRRDVGLREVGAANLALSRFETRWRNGGSPVLRGLLDAGAIELLGGPATHPFLPLLRPEVAAFALRTGLDDTRLRLGHSPVGIWAPECGYRPGLADLYAAQGVGHFLLDGPSMRHVGADTDEAHPIGNSGVLAFGRDLEVTYRVWSPRRGYPGGPWYRDFHAFDTEWGFRDRRVTSTRTQGSAKAPYDPDRAAAAVAKDAADFVDVVVSRLLRIRDHRDGRPGLTVAGFDTELFGHWWHEGPEWLERILRLLPEAGVRVTTLRGAAEHGLVGEPIRPESGSWGAGKDWHVWAGQAVYDMVADNDTAQGRVLDLLKSLEPTSGRSAVADQLARNLLLALASDWAFMTSHKSAAGYARQRHDHHHAAVAELSAIIEEHGWEHPHSVQVAAVHRESDGLLGHLDARLLA